MRPKFNSQKQILRAVSRVSTFLDFDTFSDISGIFYDTLKISTLRIKRKIIKGKKKRHNSKLSNSSITSIFRLLHYFHHNDKYTRLNKGSKLIGCYHPKFGESDALKYIESFLEGKSLADQQSEKMYFPTDFMRCLYKDKEGKHKIESEFYVPVRGKRLPLIEDTVINTTNIFRYLDSSGTLNRMYINRYVDFFDREFYMIVIGTKNNKDKTNPFRAKTAFPIFKYNDVLRILERYEV